MRVYRVASFSVAVGLKVGVISVAGLLVGLVRSDDVPGALASYLLNLGWITAFVVVVGLVLAPIWLRRRSAGALPVGARVASFADALRPDKIDLLLTIVIVGCPFLFSAEDAGYYAALLMAGAIGAGAQALLIRVWERRRGVVVFQKAGWAWGFPLLYSKAPRA